MMRPTPGIVLIRGGGDLATGIALRLLRCGMRVVICELPQPLVVRRLVSFAEAVYRGAFSVEGIPALKVESLDEVLRAFSEGVVPVVVDPQCDLRFSLQPAVLVDARLTKRPPEIGLDAAPLVVGVGPGFTPGENCHVVVETRRGHTLGRVYWDQPPAADTGIPGSVTVGGVVYREDRVVRAPANGVFQANVEIGAMVQHGDLLGEVAGVPVIATAPGVVRGLLHTGVAVTAGLKVGDIDPRGDRAYCTQVSDKALAIGGGVVEAVLTRLAIRRLVLGQE